jgi:LEA14-like dessication related protein
MKKIFPIVLLLFALSLSTGCEILKKFVKNPEVKFEKTTLVSTTLFKGDYDFYFTVTNPNPIGVKVDAVSYCLVVEGKKTLEGTLTQGVDLPAMASNSVKIPMSVNYVESAETLLDLFKKDSISYELSGSFKISSFTVPFSHKDIFTIPKPPTVKVKGVNITSMTFTGARLALQLEVTNPSPGRIDVNRISYSVSLAGFKLFDGKKENVSIEGNAANQVFTVPLSVDFLTLGKSAMTLFSQGNIDYELDGNMEFDVPGAGLKNFPFKKTGSTGLTR